MSWKVSMHWPVNRLLGKVLMEQSWKLRSMPS